MSYSCCPFLLESPQPTWWHVRWKSENIQANPTATVDLPGRSASYHEPCPTGNTRPHHHCNTVRCLREHLKDGQAPGAVPCDIPVPPWALFPGRSTNIMLVCQAACSPVTAGKLSWVLPDLRSDVGRKCGNRGLLPWHQGPLHPWHSAGTSYWDSPSLVSLHQQNTL